MIKDIKMIEAMNKYGGSFVKALAQALQQADPENYYKLIATFPEYVKTYKEMSRN